MTWVSSALLWWGWHVSRSVNEVRQREGLHERAQADWHLTGARRGVGNGAEEKPQGMA